MTVTQGLNPEVATEEHLWVRRRPEKMAIIELSYLTKAGMGRETPAIHTWRPEHFVAVLRKETIDGVEYLSALLCSERQITSRTNHDQLEINVVLPRGKCGLARY